MAEPTPALEVRIWGKRAGAVALDPQLGYYAFEYDPKFKASGIELAPLTMPIAQAGEPFVFLDLPELTYKRLPAMLADALPDEFGRALIDAWKAQKGAARDQITWLDRLAYMGRRGMGALEFRPVQGPTSGRNAAVKIAGLVESARLAVQGNLGTDEEAAKALAQIIQVGTSAGGVRAKAVVAWNPETQELRAGQFDVAEGFEHWLLKLDGLGEDRELGLATDFGRIEFGYHKMALAAGIRMAPCRLLEENGRAHFMTRRFDRIGNKKVHMQSLCAMAHLDYKQKATHDYSQMLYTISNLGLGPADLEEALRRMAFNVMARNCDDHTKNFSFLLAEGGAWESSPAYDLTHAFNPKGEWTFQHLMSVNGKFADITRQDLLAVADRFGVGTGPRVINRVAEAVKCWPEFAREAGVNLSESARVAADHIIL